MSRILPEALRADITDRASGEAWLRALNDADMVFHLEDNPNEILDGRAGDGSLLFDWPDHNLIRDRVGKLYALNWAPHTCPIGYQLDVIEADADGSPWTDSAPGRDTDDPRLKGPVDRLITRSMIMLRGTGRHSANELLAFEATLRLEFAEQLQAELQDV